MTSAMKWHCSTLKDINRNGRGGYHNPLNCGELLVNLFQAKVIVIVLQILLHYDKSLTYSGMPIGQT